MATLSIREMREKRDALGKRGSEMFDAADAAGRSLNEAEWSDWQQIRADLNDVGTQIADADKREKDEQEARAYIRQVSGSFGKAADSGRVEDGLAKGKSLGQLFAESAQFKQFMAQFPGGRIPESFKGLNSPPVSIPMPMQMMAALLTGLSDTAAGAFVANDMQNIYVPYPQRPITLIDLITVSSTDSDTVEYVRQTARTNAAAPTAEATTTSDGTKSESSTAFVKVTHAVETIAHWIPATKRALADVGQLRSIIDADLRYGLNEELEDQMMNGNGSTPNFRGMFNTSGIQTQAFSTDLFTTTRKALTLMRTVARESPTGWIFNPSNWEAFELLKDGEDRYYFGGPFATGPSTLWGYRVALCDAMLEGHAFLGNLRRAWLWVRENITITASDSHADFFIQNLVAILAEMRAAFGVTKPSALVKISLSAAS